MISYISRFFNFIEKHENVDFTIVFLMISDEKVTEANPPACLVLVLLWYVFNDFVYFKIF